MGMNKSYKTKAILLIVFGLLASTASSAWHRHGGWQERYGHYNGYNPYHHSFKSFGRSFHFGNGGWPNPEVIIRLPSRHHYYAPDCRRVEVCRYGHCWLETICER